jgi:hypothetical protein
VVDVAPEMDEVRAAEPVGSFCLATDVAMGLPFEHGLRSTLVAMRLAERMGVDPRAGTQTYYGCLLVWAGCTHIIIVTVLYPMPNSSKRTAPVGHVSVMSY